MLKSFVPTHEITLRQKGKMKIERLIPVMLEDNGEGKNHSANGPAYTMTEWFSGYPADWECIDSEWTFQGRETPDPKLEVTVRSLQEKTCDGLCEPTCSWCCYQADIAAESRVKDQGY